MGTVWNGTFGALDWAIVFGMLAVTTLLGLAFGRQATIREFFLGGRKLPWWAVSASIVATEISAVTLVSVPFVVYRPGGNFAYLQIVLVGWVLARLAIAWWLVPAYYEREIYSPMEYVGSKLGPRARDVTTALFALGGTLSQAARVYLTALVLEVVLHAPLAQLSAVTHVPTLALSIGILTAFAILWTWIGGVVAVIWTDFLLFFVFLASAIVMLVVVAQNLDLGFERLWRVGVDAHKVDFFDFDASPVKAYTFWAAAIAATWGGVAAYGVDQLMAQRLFCCRGVREARKALVFSAVGVVVPVLVAFVGVGLFAYYERNPMSPAALALYQAKGEHLLPIFVTEVVPTGLKGLIVAGIFAAAISSLDAVLAALAQAGLSSVYLPWRRWQLARAPANRSSRGSASSAGTVSQGGEPAAADRPSNSASAPSSAHAGSDMSAPRDAAEEKRAMLVSRLFVLLAGLALAALAYKMHSTSRRYGSVLDLALEMATYTQGALLAGFALAYWAPRRGGAGFLWSAPLSVAGVFAVAWHGPRSAAICPWIAAAFAGLWFVLRAVPDWRAGLGFARVALQFATVVGAGLLLVWVNRHGEFLVERNPGADPEWIVQRLAFPWYVPIGSAIAFTGGLLWARLDSASRTHPLDERTNAPSPSPG